MNYSNCTLALMTSHILMVKFYYLDYYFYLQYFT